MEKFYFYFYLNYLNSNNYLNEFKRNAITKSVIYVLNPAKNKKFGAISQSQTILKSINEFFIRLNNLFLLHAIFPNLNIKYLYAQHF